MVFSVCKIGRFVGVVRLDVHLGVRLGVQFLWVVKTKCVDWMCVWACILVCAFGVYALYKLPFFDVFASIFLLFGCTKYRNICKL